MSWLEWILLQEGISVALMTSGLLLCTIGFVRRRKTSACGADKKSRWEQAQSLILIGGIQMAVASYMVLRGSRYAHIGVIILGVALIALGMTMRPEGKKIVWGWAFGFAENCTPRGKVVFFVGLFLAIFGMTLLLRSWLDR